MELRDETIIDAPIERVWGHTVDVEALPDLTPTMTAVERLDDGPLAVGSRTRITQPGMRPNVWTVRHLDAPRELIWDTRVATVTIQARHLLEELDRGTRNTLELRLTGFGGGLLGRLLRGRLAEALATENAGFASAAEQPA